MASKALRVVSEDERPAKPMTLLEAVETGDPLEIAKANRRIIAEGLMTAGDTTRPQYSIQLAKLTEQIEAMEAARRLADPDRVSPSTAKSERRGWDASAI